MIIVSGIMAVEPSFHDRMVELARTVAAESLKEPGCRTYGLWSDPDVRWLAGVHEADGHSYLIREPYEELLWWLLLPRLLTMAGAPTLDRAEVKTISASLQAALAAAEAAGYRIDLLIGRPDEDQPDKDLPAASAAKPSSTETPVGKTAKTEASKQPEPATEVHKV